MSAAQQVWLAVYSRALAALIVAHPSYDTSWYRKTAAEEANEAVRRFRGVNP